MPRSDIWKDGINSQFSSTNQPPNRGRKKGRRNRLTILRSVFAWIQETSDALDQQRRDNRNTRRRERYQAKKRVGGTTHPTQ